MNPSLGRITARLAEPEEAKVSGLIQLLNTNIDPPNRLSEDDVYIRAMYIVSDEVNSYGGCFPSDEHARMCELLVDSPVMVGHRKDKLPIGRNFHAVQIEREGRRWIKSYFYWLKNAEGAANLRENIDGGIYKECSVGFTFHLPECSICGKDIRLCPHEPFETYRTGEGEKVCHFNYRRIERVLETSLVYRGATPDTSVSKELRATVERCDECVQRLSELDDIASLDADGQYLIVPRYESIYVEVEKQGGRLWLSREDGLEIPEEVTARFPLENLPKELKTQARLVGYRGKERCSVSDVESFLEDGEGNVSRLVLHLLPGDGMRQMITGDNQVPYDVRVIAHRLSRRDDIERKAGEIKTRAGVEVWPVDGAADALKGYWYQPAEQQESATPRNVLCLHSGSDGALLTLQVADERACFFIERFNAVLLLKGRRFVADLATGSDKRGSSSRKPLLEVPVERVTCGETGLEVRLGGDLKGEYVLRPIVTRGASRYLFYKTMREGR